MTGEGESLHLLMKNLRDLCHQLSDLMATTTKLLRSHKWTGTERSWFKHTSKKLGNPDSWFPREVGQFYRSSEYPTVLAFVSVLLDDPTDRYAEYQGVSEPLLTAGWYEYDKRNTLRRDKEYWYLWLHAYHKKRTDNGKIHRLSSSHQDWEDENIAWRKARSFAFPLTTFTSTRDLQERIVQPLLDGISGEVQ